MLFLVKGAVILYLVPPLPYQIQYETENVVMGLRMDSCYLCNRPISGWVVYLKIP